MAISGVAAVHSRCKTVACRARIVSGGGTEIFGSNMAEAMEWALHLFWHSLRRPRQADVQPGAQGRTGNLNRSTHRHSVLIAVLQVF
jgi:hypothetical protein